MTTSRHACATLVSALGLTAIGLLGGCANLFRPSAAEPPAREAVPANYSSAAATLRTIALAVAAKSAGVETYMGAFAESTTASTPGFHQFFHPQVAERWEHLTGRTVPPDWDVRLERRFFEYFSNIETNPFEFEWSKDDTHPDAGAEASTDSLYRDYRVFSIAEDGTSTIIARGSARLEFARTLDNRWLVTRWRDLIDPADDQLTLGARRLESQ